MPHQLKTLEDLKPAPYNPREITPDAAVGLSTSIEQFERLKKGVAHA